MPQGPWQDLFARYLETLRPDLSEPVRRELASVLWVEACDLSPFEAAEIEAGSWRECRPH
ncbi:MAG TPA: hypothetical protein VJ743_14160 [Albitalea sp.]|nr:hypothetical protein [Albitalea sp.]